MQQLQQFIDIASGRISVAVSGNRRTPSRTRLEHGVSDNQRAVRRYQPVPASIDEFCPFGLGTKGDAQDPVEMGFFLKTARVGRKKKVSAQTCRSSSLSQSTAQIITRHSPSGLPTAVKIT